MNCAIRWGAKCCGRRGSRPGRAYAGSGLVVAIRSGYYAASSTRTANFADRGAARLLKVDPESEPAERDSEQAAPRVGSSAHTSARSAAPPPVGALTLLQDSG